MKKFVWNAIFHRSIVIQTIIQAAHADEKVEDEVVYHFYVNKVDYGLIVTTQF